MFLNHLFEKLSNYVEKNYGVIQLGRIKHSLIGFENNNYSRCLEMRWPMSQINAGISDIDEFANAIFASDNKLYITPD